MKAAIVLCTVIAGAVGEQECNTCKTRDKLGDVLLQNQDHVTKTVMEDEPSSTNHVEFDGITKSDMPRREISGKFVRELLVRYPLDKNPGLSVKDGKARMEFGQMLEGFFMRTAHSAPKKEGDNKALTDPDEEKDFGVVRQMAWTSNSDKLGKLMFGEKSHTYTMPSNLTRFSADRLKADHEAQGAWEKGVSAAMADNRAFASNAVALGVAGQLPPQSIDINHYKTLMGFVRGGKRAPDQSFLDAAAIARTEMSDFNGKKSASVIRTSMGCQHFEDFDGITFNGHGAEIALNQKMVAFRGRLSSYPNEEYQLANGVGIWSHDEENNVLELFVGYSSVAHFVDTPGNYASMFSVGPVDGDKVPIVPEGRQPAPPMNPMQSHFVGITKSIPRDYTYQSRDRFATGCSDELLSLIPEHSVKALKAMMTPNPGPAEFHTTLATLGMLTKCWSGYQRPLGQGAIHSAYDWPEALAMTHMLSEIPGPYLVIGVLQDWNRINIL